MLRSGLARTLNTRHTVTLGQNQFTGRGEGLGLRPPQHVLEIHVIGQV